MNNWTTPEITEIKLSDTKFGGPVQPENDGPHYDENRGVWGLGYPSQN